MAKWEKWNERLGFGSVILVFCKACVCTLDHDDVIKWKQFPRYWPFVRGILRWLVNYPHKGQWRGALMFPLIYAWIKAWGNNREAGDLRRHRTHYDVIVMCESQTWWCYNASPLTFSLMPILNWIMNETLVARDPGSQLLHKYTMIFIYFVLFLLTFHMPQLFLKHKYEFIFYISHLHWSLRWRTWINSFLMEDNGPFIPISLLFGRCCML